MHAFRAVLAVLCALALLFGSTATVATATAETVDATAIPGDSIDVATAIDTTAAIDGTTNETGETVNDTDEAIDSTAGTVNETAGTVNETLDETAGTVNETVGAVNETVEAIGETGSESIDELEENASAGSDGGTGESLVESLGETAGELVGTVASTTASTGGAVLGSAATLAEGVGGSGTVLEGLLEERSDAGAALGITVSTVVVAGANSMAAGGAAAAPGLQSSLSSATGRRSGLRYARLFGERPWKFLASVLRYSRYDDSDPLEHDRRRAIYDEIVENPGLYLSEVETSTDVPLSTARHHLRILEEENLVRSETIRSKRRYFPVGVGEDERVAIGLDATKRRILELLSCEPAPNARLADELELDPSTVSHHLGILEDEGLVVRERDGRRIVNRLAPPAADALGNDRPAAIG